MKISACMIVKNEIETLPACLRTLVGYVDEIVIVDTGSEDGTQYLVDAWNAAYGNNGTKFIAGEFTDYKEWSFSEARNYAMSLASGDWLFTVDADDRIEIKDWEELLKFLKSDQDLLGEYDLVACEILNCYGENGRVEGSLLQPRFFRRSSGPVYQGKVHNNITFPSLDRKHNGIASPMRIYHTGYGMISPEAIAKKNERVVSMTKEDVEKNPKSAFAWFNYGNALKSKMVASGTTDKWNEEDKKLAFDALTRAMDCAGTGDNHHFIDAVTLKGWLHYVSRELTEADECANMAMKEKRDHVDAILLKACVNHDLNKLDVAEFWLKQYLIANRKLNVERRYDYVACQQRNQEKEVYELLASVEEKRRQTEQRYRAMLLR